jgi:hypothetical protein
MSAASNVPNTARSDNTMRLMRNMTFSQRHHRVFLLPRCKCTGLALHEVFDSSRNASGSR